MLRAVSKSWLLHASTCARAMATAGDSCCADIGFLLYWLAELLYCYLDGGQPRILGGWWAPSSGPRRRLYWAAREARLPRVRRTCGGKAARWRRTCSPGHKAETGMRSASLSIR